MQCEEVFHKHCAGGGGEAKGQDTRIFVGHRARNRRSQIRSDDRVFLKCAFGGLVAPLIQANCVADDTIADFKARDALADLDDLAGEIAAENERVLDPGEHQVACGLF